MKQEPMPENIVEDFRRILGLAASDPIPKDIEEAYLTYRYKKDLCGAGAISVSELILLVMMTGKNSEKAETETAEKTKPKATRSKPKQKGN